MFTDIEGSTALVRRLGDRFEDVLERQQVLIRAAAAAQSGEEQSREGDSLFFTFPSATAGLATAVDAQCRLEHECWPPDSRVRVRIGLHIGEVADTRAGLVGLAIHRAARIMSAAHGGQIVVSGDVVQHAGRLPTDTKVRRSERMSCAMSGRRCCTRSSIRSCRTSFHSCEPGGQPSTIFRRR